MRPVPVAIGLAVGSLATVTALVIGAGNAHPAQEVRMASGAAWLASTRVGQITLLDGTSAEVAAQVQVAPVSDAIDVVQQGANAYVVDRTAGTLSRVDGATFDVSAPVAPLLDARGGLAVFAGADALYTVDTERGLLATADPRTLAPRGSTQSLAARLSAGGAVLDDRSTLWVVDTATGDLTRVGESRETRRGVARPGASLLTLANGKPVLVDTADRVARLVDPETGEPGEPVALDMRADDVPRVSGSPHADRIYLVTGRGVVSVCDLDASACDNAVVVGTPASRMGAAVEAGGKLFVPDYADGTVWVVDLLGRNVVAKSTVLTPPGEFQLLTRDGVVFYNDPDSERAGVIRLDGAVVPSAKYDPKDPAKGLRASPTSGPTPTAVPTTSATSASSTTRPPEPTRSTPQPTTRPILTQPEPTRGQPTTATQTTTTTQTTQPTTTRPPAPTPQIVLSKANPMANEPVTLRVDTSTGVVPTAATWSYGDNENGSGRTVTHSWPAAQTYLVSVQATLPDGSQLTTSVSVPVSAQPAPTLVSPRDNAVMTDFPRALKLTWQPAAGATGYLVEVECACSSTQPWVPSTGAPITTAATSADVTMAGDNDARWRVSALAPNGSPAASSPWRRFKFTTGPFDMLEAAPTAAWRTGAGAIAFNGTDGDVKGFALRRDGAYSGCTLEDGSAPSYMETHPEMKPGGWIDGTYTLPGPVSAGQHFTTKVGYIKCGSVNQGIDDFVVIAIMPNGQQREVRRLQARGTDGVLDSIDVDLTSVVGATKLRLRVEDGPPNGQDWACWIGPRVAHQ